VDQLKLSMRDVQRITGESPPVVYSAIEHGHLKTFVVGRRRFARPEAVRAWVDFMEAESDAGRPLVYKRRVHRAAA